MIKYLIKALELIEKKNITYKSVCQDVYKLVVMGLIIVSINDAVVHKEDHQAKAEELSIERKIVEDGKEEHKLGEAYEEKINKTDKEKEVEKEEKDVFVTSSVFTGLGEDQLDFLSKVIPMASNLSEEYGLYTSIMVAQAILESDWSRSELAVGANNLFGIKGSFEGNSYSKKTLEDDGQGNKYEITAKFAKYPSIRESLESNAKLLAQGLSYDSNFYQGTWKGNAANYKESAQSLTGTYATDIEYSQKLIRIIEKYQLHELDE